MYQSATAEKKKKKKRQDHKKKKNRKEKRNSTKQTTASQKPLFIQPLFHPTSGFVFKHPPWIHHLVIADSDYAWIWYAIPFHSPPSSLLCSILSVLSSCLFVCPSDPGPALGSRCPCRCASTPHSDALAGLQSLQVKHGLAWIQRGAIHIIAHIWSISNPIIPYISLWVSDRFGQHYASIVSPPVRRGGIEAQTETNNDK